MNTQKLFLFIAIFLTVFLLWKEWELTQSTDENGNVTTQAQLTGTNSSTENIDALEVTYMGESSSTENEAIDALLIDNDSSQIGVITVITDTLKVEISEKGGTIINAYLLKHPKELLSEESFQLLSNSPGNILYAQSGLLPFNEMANHTSLFTSERQEYFLQDNNELTVPLTWKGDNGIEVTKNFHFKPDSYIVEVDYKVNNKSNTDQTVQSYTRLVHDGHSLGSGGFLQMGLRAYEGGAIYNDSEKFQKIAFDEFDDSNLEIKSIGGWTALMQHYFISAWIPKENIENSFSTRSTSKSFEETKARNGNFELTTKNLDIKIAAGSSATLEKNKLYIGPKEYVRLSQLATDLEKTRDYGWLSIVADPLSKFLHWIYSYVGNWALSIVLLTLSIKLAFYKLSEKSFRSMAGMKKLAPRLQKIKETYEGDKQKIGKKTMELYRKEKINPAAGCLPILVQIPVFISVYWVLIEMVELRQTPFLYLPDLAAKDPYFILPLIMGASMWFQQRLNPPPADPIQARIMMMLPIVFTVFFLFFPSGLVLYWVTNNVLSIAQQIYINKKINE